ncbi:uncharacterized protein G2W53_018518 [Senna tora]|uniref:Uncharacterized protein n=1 Tax=Senna tora TaxID=362788 RepID=A0A834U0P2_9FABA|nr:uncharacterized protein G2W53_018518 [Senna tora]
MQISYLMNENSPYLKLIFTSGQKHLGGEDFIDRLIDSMAGEDLFEGCLQRINEFLNEAHRFDGCLKRVNEFLNEVDIKGADVNHLILIHLGGEDFIDRLIDRMVGEDLFERCLQRVVNEFLNDVDLEGADVNHPILVGEDSIHRLIDSMVGEDLFEGCLQKVNQYLNQVDLEGADVNHLILVDYATPYCRISSIESKDYTNFYVLVVDLASSFMQISYLMNGNSPYLKLIFTSGQMHLGGVDFIDRLIDSMVDSKLYSKDRINRTSFNISSEFKTIVPTYLMSFLVLSGKCTVLGQDKIEYRHYLQSCVGSFLHSGHCLKRLMCLQSLQQSGLLLVSSAQLPCMAVLLAMITVFVLFGQILLLGSSWFFVSLKSFCQHSTISFCHIRIGEIYLLLCFLYGISLIQGSCGLVLSISMDNAYKSNPSIVDDPSLTFFKSYLLSKVIKCSLTYMKLCFDTSLGVDGG